jgi:RNA polymerase sigma factor (TIGR02999 family)
MAEQRRLVTQLLHQLDLSDPGQADQLLSLVYGELRRLASSQMQRERADHTLQPTELVHEAYVRLVDTSDLRWESRAHFFGTAARAMRQILVDHARHANAQKRGSGMARVTLSGLAAQDESVTADILDLHRALEALDAQARPLAALVELRFFAGLTVAEAADTLGVSPRKAAKDWAAARLWLQRELDGTGERHGDGGPEGTSEPKRTGGPEGRGELGGNPAPDGPTPDHTHG